MKLGGWLRRAVQRERDGWGPNTWKLWLFLCVGPAFNTVSFVMDSNVLGASVGLALIAIGLGIAWVAFGNSSQSERADPRTARSA